MILPFLPLWMSSSAGQCESRAQSLLLFTPFSGPQLGRFLNLSVRDMGSLLSGCLVTEWPPQESSHSNKPDRVQECLDDVLGH